MCDDKQVVMRISRFRVLRQSSKVQFSLQLHGTRSYTFVESYYKEIYIIWIEMCIRDRCQTARQRYRDLVSRRDLVVTSFGWPCCKCFDNEIHSAVFQFFIILRSDNSRPFLFQHWYSADHDGCLLYTSIMWSKQ